VSLVVRTLTLETIDMSALAFGEVESRAAEMLLRAEREAAELLAKIDGVKDHGDHAEGATPPARPDADSSAPAPCRLWLALARESRPPEDKAEQAPRP
jgi:hypothetical protein